ncbi:DNA-3-methyladenine glycosylase [Jonesiaceae bacterium BS-20]|uniref:Putative 3-methyladenine DNA glycosylase n=1 Tax=Jonesiaceae bacterium BS-20 TaxID=3120821 RepID=A0AAU7DTD8_9MICO
MDRTFFLPVALEVAPRLLGGLLTTNFAPGPVTVRITEVEAYHGLGVGDVHDSGSHARKGMTPRVAPMFGPPGHLYVYCSYGIHSAANMVCSPDGQASGCLLRAGEIVGGLEVARGRRPLAKSDRDLARGPGRLAQALGLDYREHNGIDVLTGPVSFTAGPPVPDTQIGTSPRTGVNGVAGSEQFRWRFYLLDDKFVSPFRAGKA